MPALDWQGVLTGQPLQWIVSGFLTTLWVTLAGAILASLLALLFLLLRLSGGRFGNGVVSCWVSLFRNTPLLVQLLFWYFAAWNGLPLAFRDLVNADHSWSILPGGVWWFTPEFLCSAWGLGVFTSAFLIEEVESGLRSVPDGQREAALSQGVYNTYISDNLRYSQNAPLNMYDEVNTKCNLPAQIDIEATEGMEYKFLCVTKGGGSANKTYLYQETKAILNPGTLVPFIIEKIKTLGTAACPPYHIAFVIGGTSAEKNLLTVKLASTHYYDELPTTGNEYGRAFRDVELEKQVLEEAYKIGLGAQFGGKYMAHDVRIIRLPRHGASCPIGLGVSCSADRNIKCKINKDGIWIEKMDDKPGELIPEALREAGEGDAVKIDLNQPMADILKELTKYPVATRLSLNGTIIVGRDIAHAKLKERFKK